MIWLVILLPLLGSIINGFFLKRLPKFVSHVTASSAMVLSFICALVVFSEFLGNGSNATTFQGFDWITAGSLQIPFRLIVDQISGIMILVVTGIGSLIHVYAGGYLHEEQKTYRFFAYLNLFVFMMLLLVLGDNLPLMFVGWEGVGLCSYLLIGYWFDKDANAAAGMKAFLVNRIGDIGFLLGMFICFKTFGTLSFTELRGIISSTTAISAELQSSINLMTLCLFIGACGKSAQIPLYVWLPDAMAGPTPVSALIHAATMVTAGIYMMTRLNFMYYLSPSTMAVVATVGALTALFAATIAVCQNDIKKVLAYSTVSQLGFMVLGCGAGSFNAGFFHLLTHACFKALMFLGAGSVIVAMHHKQDMMEMGGLAKKMPITHGVFLIGVLAIIGFPGLSGFFSKDEILWKTYLSYGPGVWAIAVVAALFTAFYMVRLLCLTFYGQNRADAKTQEHIHETPAHMWAPLVVLAVLSVVIGWIGIPAALGGQNHLKYFLKPVMLVHSSVADRWAFLTSNHDHATELSLMGASVLGVFLSAGFAVLLYRNGPPKISASTQKSLEFLQQTLANKYWIDELYNKVFVQPLKDMSQFLWKIVDVVIVDGLVNAVAQACAAVAGYVSFSMSGSLHRHAALVILGVVSLLTVILV